MDVRAWLQGLATQPGLTLVGGVFAFALGTIFGKALPWWTTSRKVAHDIAMDKLRQLEDSLDRDTRRAATLISGFRDEPSPPGDQALEGLTPNDLGLVQYQRARHRTAQELPSILADLSTAREELVSARKRLLGNPKSDVKATLNRIQGSSDQVDRRLNEVLERLAAQPRVFVGTDEPLGGKDGDIWLHL